MPNTKAWQLLTEHHGKWAGQHVQLSYPDRKKQNKTKHRTKQTSVSAFTLTNSETPFEAIPDIITNAAYVQYSNSEGRNSIFTIPLVK